MKKIIVTSKKGKSIAEAVSRSGCSVSAVDPDHFDDRLLDNDSAVIMDLDDGDDELNGYIAELCRLKGTAVCAVSGMFTGDTAAFLKKNGIAMYMHYDELMASPQSAAHVGWSGGSEGVAVIADDDPVYCSILAAIFSLFGYTCILVTEIDELFESIEGASFIIHNLTMKTVDLLPFVKRASHSQIFKNIPYIAYKSSADGVSLHEINCGIVRLTSYILSSEEVWSVVAYNLFRKEIFSRADAFSKHLKIDDNRFFAQESMKKIYYSKDAQFFTSASRAAVRKNIEAADKVRSIDDTLSKMRMLAWLVHDEDGQKVISAGV